MHSIDNKAIDVFQVKDENTGDIKLDQYEVPGSSLLVPQKPANNRHNLKQRIHP